MCSLSKKHHFGLAEHVVPEKSLQNHHHSPHEHCPKMDDL